MPAINIFAEVRAYLLSASLRNLTSIADGAGVPLSTVRKIRYAETANPRIKTVQAIYDFMAANGNAKHVEGPPPCRADDQDSVNGI